MSKSILINDNIFVAGHNGMVGASIVRELNRKGYYNIITADRNKLDLTNQAEVEKYFLTNKIDNVVVAAAKVGGIYANNEYPAEFIYENIMIECNLVNSALHAGVQRLLYLGSSCIYPKFAKQPIKEQELLTGKLEATNEPYAIAKIAGIKLCESYNRQYGTNYRSLMPTNLYGRGDNFHPVNSHVIPGLIQRFHKAKLNNDNSVTTWGTGNAMREFLHIDDMASACVYVMELSDEIYSKNMDPMCSHINVGTGIDTTINDLAKTLKDIVGFSGTICFDTTKPDGPPRKVLDIIKLKSLGWTSQISLRKGLNKTYKWYLQNIITGVRVN